MAGLGSLCTTTSCTHSHESLARACPRIELRGHALLDTQTKLKLAGAADWPTLPWLLGSAVLAATFAGTYRNATLHQDLPFERRSQSAGTTPGRVSIPIVDADAHATYFLVAPTDASQSVLDAMDWVQRSDARKD